MFKKINSNPVLAAIIYGTLSSLLASALLDFVPTFWGWLRHSSWEVIVDFVDYRYVRAATLEPVNYAFFLLVGAFVVVAIIWFELSGRIRKLFFPPATEVQNDEKDAPQWMKWGAYVLIQFVTPAYLFYLLFQISGEVVVLNAITDFKQHMLIVTPYIRPQEKDKLLSQWSQMRSSEDYEKVYEKLLTVAKDNNLKLYRNRFY